MSNEKSFEKHPDKNNASDDMHNADAYIRNVFMQTPAAIVVLKGPFFVIDIVNDYALNMWETTREEVLNKALFEVAPQLAPGFESILANVYNVGNPYYANEFPVQSFQHTSSSSRYFNITFQPFKDLNGTVTGITCIGMEVTAEIITRNRIEESEKKYHTLFNSIDEGFCIIKVLFDDYGEAYDYRFIETNLLFEKQTGLTDPVGRTMKELVPEYEQHWFDIYGKVAKTGESARFENAAKEIGHYYDVYAFRINEPERRHVAVLFNDITERKRHESNIAFLAEIGKDLALLSSVQETLSVIGSKIGKHFNVSRCDFAEINEQKNEAVIIYDWHVEGLPDIAGDKVYGLRDFIADEFYDDVRAGNLIVVDNVAGDHRIKNDKAYAPLNTCSFITSPFIKDDEWQFLLSISDTQPREWRMDEIELIRELGDRIWASLEKARTEQALKDNEVRLLQAMQAGHESEAALRQVKDQLNLSISAGRIGIWKLDVKSNYLSWNKEQLDLYGITEADFGNTPQAFVEFVHPEDREKVMKEDENARAETAADQTFQFRITRKDGKERWIEARSKSIFDDNGHIDAVMGINIDITGEKVFSNELERKVQLRTAQIEQQNRELQKVNKELEAFTYVASHDLQEPLRKIQTFSGRIIETDETSLSETAKDYFSRMQNAALRMQTLIQDLLSFSRFASSERNFELILLQTIIKEVTAELKESIKAKNASIELTGMCEVKIIPFQFRQLMHNLISNSLKFSKTGIPLHIDISVELLEQSPLLHSIPAHHIIYTDNGIGFDPRYAEKVFELFQKLHTRDEYSGTGIGLAIVKKIMENHNGIVTATSELNKGVRFDIYIPV